MNLYRSTAKIGGLLIFLLTISFAPVACTGSCTILPIHPLIEISVHNQTDETLQIFFDGETFIGEALPGEEIKFETGAIFPDYEIVARDMDGNTVYVVAWTRDDLKGKETYDVYLPPT